MPDPFAGFHLRTPDTRFDSTLGMGFVEWDCCSIKWESLDD